MSAALAFSFTYSLILISGTHISTFFVKFDLNWLMDIRTGGGKGKEKGKNNTSGMAQPQKT